MVVEVLQEHDLTEGALHSITYNNSTTGLSQGCPVGLWWLGMLSTGCCCLTTPWAPRCSTPHLRVCCVLEGIKDLFESHQVIVLLVNRLPDDSIRLWVHRNSQELGTVVEPSAALSSRALLAPAGQLTPLPSFCNNAYFLST